MPDTTEVSWGRVIGTATGSVLAGPAGALVGNLAGSLLQTFFPSAAGLGPILGAIVSKTLDKSNETLVNRWLPPEKQQINHDLQTAFRDALLAALYDIGGKRCFPSQWRSKRDVPVRAFYPIAALQQQDAPLAEQACLLFRDIAAAVKEQQILPLEPSLDQPAASVLPYLQAQTPEDLNQAFFTQVVAPYLGRSERQAILAELRSLGFDLEAHLRQTLLDRTLVHLGEYLKARTPAWRAFNRLILENIQVQIHDLAKEQDSRTLAAQLSHMEAELAKVQQVLQTSNLAADLADWVAAVGRIEKQLDEGFSSLFRRIEQDHHETMERLLRLTGATGRIEAKMDRMLLILENGGWETTGTPAAPLDEPPEPGEPPFMGLQYYTEADAHLFFGRELLTARLVACLGRQRFLAVVGTSGSGKSSLIRAGVIPALRRGEPLARGARPPDGSANWLIHVITPTAHPLEALAASLTRDSQLVMETTALLEDLAREPRSLHLYAQKLLNRRDHAARANSRLLLVVDQFEELFTLCRNEQERSSFVANLLGAAGMGGNSDGQGPTTVIIILRADFYAYCAQYEELRNALVHYQDFIGPMNEDELRRAIEEPARQGGWKFERGVVELVLRDVGSEPGALPLLSHALLETWKRRRGRTMLLESYAESGMVRGAIAQTAEFVFQQRLTPEQRPLARNIFLRLTELGESTQDSRRRVALDELLSTSGQTETIESILRSLVEARLVTTGEGTVELAHEALIREWPMLRQWLVEDREWLRIHRHLTEAAQEWLALERDPGELYRGARLAQMQEQADLHWDELNDLEREFYTESQKLAEQETSEKLARQQRELEQARALAEVERQRAQEQSRASQQLRRRAMLLAGLLLMTLLLAVVAIVFGLASNQNASLARQNAATAQAASTQAIQQQMIASQNAATAQAASAHAATQQAVAAAARDRAEQQAQESLARQLAAQGLNPANGLDLALLLSLEAERIMPGSFEAKYSLLTLLQTSPQLTTFLRGHSSIVYDVAVTADGKLAASGGLDRKVLVWNLENHQPLATISGYADQVCGVLFSPDGRTLATGSEQMLLWDVNTRAPLGEPFTYHSPNFTCAFAFHPDLPIMAAGSDDGAITLWNIEEREHPVLLTEPFGFHRDRVRSLAFTPDGTILAAGSWDNTISLWNVSDPTQPERIGEPLAEHSDWVRSIAVHPDGRMLASGSSDNRVILWDIQDPANPTSIGSPLEGHTSQVYAVAFSADGKLLATSGGDKTILLWDISDPEQPTRISSPWVGQAGVIESLAFSPDGTLLSASDDSTIAVWDPAANQRLAHILRGPEAPVNDVAFSPDGALVASADDDGAVQLWDVRDPDRPQPAEAALHLETEDGMFAVAFSPDGHILAAGSDEGRIAFWDVMQPNSPQMIGAPLAAHTDLIECLAFHPTQPILASAGDDMTVRLWDVSDPTAPAPIGKPMNLAQMESALDRMRRAATPTPGDQALEADEISAEVLSLAFNADGTLLAAGISGNDILLLDPATQELKKVLSGHGWSVWGLDFYPNSNLLASGGQDSTMILWDTDHILQSVQPDDPVWALDREPALGQRFFHANTVGTVAFSPDGALLVSAGVEQKVFLWDVATRQQLGALLAAHTGTIVSADFSPNGEWLVTGGYDNAVVLWDLRLAAWREYACNIANRNLTRKEWAQYIGDAPYQLTCPELTEIEPYLR